MNEKPSRVILYPYASWYFALAMLVTWIGFSTSYFARLRDNSIFHHIHGATAGLWIAVLILQPLLYKYNRLRLHRRVGWAATLTLVPLLILGGLKMMQLSLLHQENYPPGLVYRLTFIDAYSLLQFILYLVLSLYHGRQVQTHARYMVCTVLTLLPPALTRLLFFIPWFNSFNRTLNGSFFIIEIVMLFLLRDDQRSGGIRKPYVVALGILILLHVLMNYAGDWMWWKELMNAFSQRG